MAKKTVKKVKRASGPMKVTCPCCVIEFQVASGTKATCPNCGAKINIYENESDANEAVEPLENGKKRKLSAGGGWAVADCLPNGG